MTNDSTPKPSAPFGYQAKLLSSSNKRSSRDFSLPSHQPSASSNTLPEIQSEVRARIGGSKRNSVDVAGIRGQWAQREEEARRSGAMSPTGSGSAEFGGKGPLSPVSSTGSFGSFSSSLRGGQGVSIPGRVISPVLSSSGSIGGRSGSGGGGGGEDGLKNLLHRRTKSYMPPLASSRSSDLSTNNLLGASSRTVTPPSVTTQPPIIQPSVPLETERSTSSFTSTSTSLHPQPDPAHNPQPEHLSPQPTGSSTSSTPSIGGLPPAPDPIPPVLPSSPHPSTSPTPTTNGTNPDSPRKYKSSYMAKKEHDRLERESTEAEGILRDLERKRREVKGLKLEGDLGRDGDGFGVGLSSSSGTGEGSPTSTGPNTPIISATAGLKKRESFSLPLTSSPLRQSQPLVSATLDSSPDSPPLLPKRPILERFISSFPEEDDISDTVRAFRERLEREPLYKLDFSLSGSTSGPGGSGPGASAAGGVRKKTSTSLLGEPYYPNPNPVGGVNRTRSWRPEDRSSLLDGEVPRSGRSSPAQAQSGVSGAGGAIPSRGSTSSPLRSSGRINGEDEDDMFAGRERRRDAVPLKTKSAFKNVILPPTAGTSSSSSSYPSTSTSTSNSPFSPLGPARRPSSADQNGNTLGMSAGVGTGKRYGSLGKTDGRKLGKHLPRIASGDQFDEDYEASSRKTAEEERRAGAGVEMKDGLSTPTEREKEAERAKDAPFLPSDAPIRRPGVASLPSVKEEMRRVFDEPATPKATLKRAGTVKDRSKVFESMEEANKVDSAPSSPMREGFAPGKRWTAPITPKKLVPDGRGMQGLVGREYAAPKPVEGTPALGRKDSVVGVKGRIRLSKLPLASTSAALAPAPLPSKRLNMNWMDRQRTELIAYEYLCHVGEAQQWIEGCLDEELGYGVVEMEERMIDGVALARLARKYQGEEVVRHIWEDKKHRFRQTENINYFLNFVRNIGLPETFIFETTDLYNKKNIPKVIYCIHVLSHLLARLGMAEKIGNLVGQFDFSDEQLAQAQQGLKGIAMPNFNSVGSALAKECDIEPEEEQETEEEARDRMLLEVEPEIIQLQAALRGYMQRQSISRVYNHLQLAEVSVTKFQAKARGALSRRALEAELDEKHNMDGWATQLQAMLRGNLRRKAWLARCDQIRSLESMAAGLQACARGQLVRSRHQQVEKTLSSRADVFVGLQAQLRGVLARKRVDQILEVAHSPAVTTSIVHLQAVARARLAERRAVALKASIENGFPHIELLQANIRGALLRKTLRKHVQSLDDTTDCVIGLQAAARGYLVRRHKKQLTRNLEKFAPNVVSLQALARARLATRAHKDMQKALSKVETTSAIGGLQSLLRSKLASRKTLEQKKQLEFVQPDVIGFQALARGVLARREYTDWVEYLKDEETQAGITFCQQLLRGYLARRRYYARLDWYYGNVHKIVKIQSIWRGRKQRQKYRKIASGQGVDVAAIQNFMHLLDDSETDFAEEMQVERLRKQVIENIQLNQTLESQVTELDTKIALMVQNKLSFEDLVKVKGIVGNLPSQQEERSFAIINSDPFAHSATLEKSSRRKLELYQHLFFMVQTQPKYLARLIRLQTSNNADEQGRRLLQGVVLALYSYGQSRREEYLLLKLLQLAVHEQILTMSSPKDLLESRLVVTDIALAHIRPKQGNEIKSILKKVITDLVEVPDLDLCIDPVAIYVRILNDEETESGVVSTRPRDVDAYSAVHGDEATRNAFVHQLSQLLLHMDSVLGALYENVKYIPYTIRCMAREMLLALQVKTQYQVDDADLIPVIARCLVLPYLIPAIVNPESQGLIGNMVGVLPRQNLIEIANLLTLIATGRYRVIDHDARLFGSLEGYIVNAAPAFCDFILNVASVEDVETHLQTQELVEVSVMPKPITMTRAEIYAMHGTLQRELDVIAMSKSDPLRGILAELGGVPNVLYQEGQTAPVTFNLTNRFAKVSTDPMAIAKADWVQAKRHILATLRVQSGATLIDVLTSPVKDEDEMIWEEVVQLDIHRERARRHKSSLPPLPTGGNDYRLEDIRSIPFREVKARAIQFCMKLENQEMLSRSNNWQDLLDDIAADIRTQNKNRQRRKKDHSAMDEAMVYTSDKRSALEEQISSYNKYITSAMDTMQKQGKKRHVWPFSKQARHLRSMQKQGRATKFGSYRYSALELYEKHILLPVEQMSPRQFEKLSVILSSNEIGVFTLEIVAPASSTAANNQTVGSCEVRMEDLLQAKFENRVTLDMFDQVARVRVNTLIFLINKKFYA